VEWANGRTEDAASLARARADGVSVLLATGGHPAPPGYRVAPGVAVRTDAQVLEAWPQHGAAWLPAGPVVLLDLVGGPVALGLAELLAGADRTVHLVTADQVAGLQTALHGDLADGNTRLLRAGVIRHTGMLLREVRPGAAVLEDRFSGEQREVACQVLVHCGHRLPSDELYLAAPGTPRAGDCVAPRSVLEAVLEGRRSAVALEAAPARGPAPGSTPGDHIPPRFLAGTR